VIDERSRRKEKKRGREFGIEVRIHHHTASSTGNEEDKGGRERPFIGSGKSTSEKHVL